jgi:hypothetical protein
MKVDGPARPRGGDGLGWLVKTEVDFGPRQKKKENEISF